MLVDVMHVISECMCASPTCAMSLLQVPVVLVLAKGVRAPGAGAKVNTLDTPQDYASQWMCACRNMSQQQVTNYGLHIALIWL